MRRTVIALLLVLVAPAAHAGTVRPVDARAHIGQRVTVEGIVDQVFLDRRSGVTFLDMGGRYPGNAFTAVIFPENADKFADVEGLEGRNVAVTGVVRLYRGRPEIILENPAQLSRR